MPAGTITVFVTLLTGRQVFNTAVQITMITVHTGRIIHTRRLARAGDTGIISTVLIQLIVIIAVVHISTHAIRHGAAVILLPAVALLAIGPRKGAHPLSAGRVTGRGVAGINRRVTPPVDRSSPPTVNTGDRPGLNKRLTASNARGRPGDTEIIDIANITTATITGCRRTGHR